MAITKSRHDPWQLFGLSTDVKWTDSEMPAGSKFHATDTDADYMWSGTAWETLALNTVSLSATAEVTGTLTISSGSVTLAATAQVTGTLSISSGSITLAATAQVSGALSISSGTVTLQGAKSALIYNTSVTAGDTNYSAVITSAATRFGISLQTAASTAYFRLAFATSSATTGGTALQLAGTSEYYEDKLSLTADTTVYFTVSTAPQTVQMIVWI